MTREEALVVLGLSGSPGPEEIKKAYRVLVARTHPDHGGTAEQFNQVIDAVNILSGKSAASETPGLIYVETDPSTQKVLQVTAEQLYKGTTFTFDHGGRKIHVRMPGLTPEGSLLRVRVGSETHNVRIRMLPNNIWDVRGEHIGMHIILPRRTRGKVLYTTIPWLDGRDRQIDLPGDVADGTLVCRENWGLSADPSVSMGNLYIRVQRA